MGELWMRILRLQREMMELKIIISASTGADHGYLRGRTRGFRTSNAAVGFA